MTILALLAIFAIPIRLAASPVNLRATDIVAVLGGEDMVAWQRNGLFETLLASRAGVEMPRFRYLAWEADTVFDQQRDLNFPKWPEQLNRAGATVILCQFGQAESLRGPAELENFTRAYDRLLGVFTARTPRVVLLSPTPFENPGGALPDLSRRNADLARYVEAIRQLAQRRGLPFVDLFGPLLSRRGTTPRLTRDGLHLSAHGHLLAVTEALRSMDFFLKPPLPEVDPEGHIASPALESLRQQVIAKNRLWFHYWRPENWAFLAGDRTDQPSSRDHRDRTIRWFPKEMEEYLPLIGSKENQITDLARELAKPE
jgi:hypothetical protein